MGNQTVKFGQLTKYDIRNIFLEKPYTKGCGETSPRPFSKKSKLSLSLEEQCNVLLEFVFIACPSGGLSKYIKTKGQTTCFYLL